MTKHGLGENRKRKFKQGDLSKYDLNDPYWNHNTKLSEYLGIMGFCIYPNDIMLVYVNV
jgi:hypothetical protein